MFLHLRLQIGLWNGEELGCHLHDLVDVVVGARLVDPEPALVIAVVAAPILVPLRYLRRWLARCRRYASEIKTTLKLLPSICMFAREIA